MTIPAVLVGLQISAWIGFALSPARQQRADFRAYYYAGEMIRAGQARNLYQRYDPANVTSAFIHPAYEALLFLPLTFMSMRVAHVLWIGLNCGIIYFIYRALRPDLLNLHALFTWLPLGIFAAYLPINEALMQGQDSLLLALLVSVAFERLRRGRLFEAGIWLGLGAFRFQFLAAIILLFLLWSAWRLIAGCCLSAGGMFLLSIAIAGFRAQKDYVQLLRVLADPAQQPVIHMVNLRALMTALGTTSAGILAATSVLVLVLVAWFGRAASWHSRLLMSVAAACLLSYHMFLHDLSLLIVPIIITCDNALESREYIHLGILAAALAFPTLLAMQGLPLWANSMGSMIVLTQLVLLGRRYDFMPAKRSFPAEAEA